MKTPSLSIVTVSMNRTEHVLQCARAVSRHGTHLEHVIVDWSSRTPIHLSELPNDPRIVLLRVDLEGSWHASRAYNFGFDRAHGSHLLRLDADQIIDSGFFEDNLWAVDGVVANDLTIGDKLTRSSTGLVFVPMERFLQVGGFNEYLSGWGFEDLDFLARTRGVCDHYQLNVRGCTAIQHPDSMRGIGATYDIRGIPSNLGKTFSNARNRWLSRALVWNATRLRSRYREEKGAWIAEFIPVLPAWLAEREADYVRLMELEELFRSKIDLPSNLVLRAHKILVSGRYFRVGLAFSYFVRAYARLINMFLMLVSK